ncbi:MAG: hypothetical protein HOP08_02260 [Cyclobacteriaceae bacterium]|nr:hypothetical protein [Cyclobacteriaceae bacterium]
MSKIAAVLFMVILPTCVFAQEVEVKADTVKSDTVRVENDSTVIGRNGKIINIKSYAKRFQPRKALLYSALIPGMGQAYNKKYWKMPIVYGGFIILGAYGSLYHNTYNKYRGLLIQEIAVPGSSIFSETQLRSIVDTYRRERDFFIILGGFWYLLQMVDAHVDAHLKEFDLNPKLKVSMKPSTQGNELTGRMSGFSLTLTF